MLVLHFVLLAALPAWNESVTVGLSRIVLSEGLPLRANKYLRCGLGLCGILHDIDLRQAESIRRRADSHRFFFHGTHCGHRCSEILIVIFHALWRQTTNEV